MGTHAIVGAGSVGTATALALVDAGHEVVVVTRSGSGPDHPGIRRVACRRLRPGRPGRRRRAGPTPSTTAPTRPTTAGPSCGPPWPRRMLEVATSTGRGAGHHGQPLRLRPGRPPDDRGRPAGRHRHQGADPGRHVGRRPGRPPGRPGAGHRGPGLRLLRSRRGRDQLLRPQRRPAAGRQEGLRAGRPRRAPRRHLRPRRRADPRRAGHRRAGLGPAVARPDGPGGQPAADGRAVLRGGRRPAGPGRCAAARRCWPPPGSSPPGPRVQGDPVPVRPAVPARLVGVHRHLRDRPPPRWTTGWSPPPRSRPDAGGRRGRRCRRRRRPPGPPDRPTRAAGTSRWHRSAGGTRGATVGTCRRH